MSPLGSSLLAFASLLAAAGAIENPFCDGVDIGDFDTKDVINFKMTASGDFYLIIPDKCSRPGRELVGQTIGVCNPPNNKPKISILLDTYPYTAVEFDCPWDVPGCSKLEVSVAQYCKPSGLPPVLRDDQ